MSNKNKNKKMKKGEVLLLSGFFLVVMACSAFWVKMVFGETSINPGTLSRTTQKSANSAATPIQNNVANTKYQQEGVKKIILEEAVKVEEKKPAEAKKYESANKSSVTSSDSVLPIAKSDSENSTSATPVSPVVNPNISKPAASNQTSVNSNSAKTSSASIPVENKNIQIDTKVKEAEKVDKVDVYVKNDAASQATPQSLMGRATKSESEAGSWKLDVDASQNLPNGDYSLYSKVQTEEGEYVVGEKRINVNLPVENISEEAKKEIESKEDSSIDSDQDGIPDKEELRLNTNPFSVDTDQDGYLDEDEIKNGFDPAKPSAGDKSDKVVFQSPKEMGEVSEKYTVTNVEKVEQGDKKMKLKGKGLPNSFITIYIYSTDPIVVTVKTDANGNWQYDLDKDLEDGEHEVYVAVNDNTGKITAKSEPLKFIKTAQAVEVVEAAGLDQVKLDKNQSPVKRSGIDFIFFSFILISAFIGLAVFSVGLLINYRHNQNEGINQEGN